MDYTEKKIKALKRMNARLNVKLKFKEERIDGLLAENQALVRYRMQELIDDETMIGSPKNIVLGFDKDLVDVAILRWSDEFK